MASLSFPDDYEDDESQRLLICTGDNIDFGSSQSDAVIEVTQMDHTGEYVAMCPYGFTLNLRESKQLRDMLNEAIAHAEISNEYTD